MLGNRLIKSNNAGGGACTNTVDLYNPFPDGGGVALYQLNGDATDVSGNYDGTATNVTYGAGQFGQAGVFNGASKVVLPTPSIISSNLIFSLSIWIKGSSISSADFNAVYLNFNGSYFIMTVSSNNAIASFSNSSSQSYSIPTTSAPLDANAWNHVVISSTGLSGNCNIYVNGSFETSGALQSTTRTITLTDGNALGTISGVIAYPFQGSIDQVRIFNRALRPYEVEALYTEKYCTPTIVPSEHFNTVLWTGNEVSGRQITGVGFQPDFVWIKDRGDGTHWHNFFDSVRGASERLFSNATNAESFYNESLQSFNSDGFTVGFDPDVNRSGGAIVGWSWKAGGAAVTNTDGTITSQVSANTEAGFSVVSYTGNGITTGQSFGHGLSERPNMIIVKNRTTSAGWDVLFPEFMTSGQYMALNSTNGITNSANSGWGGSLPDSSKVFVGGSSWTNTNGNAYIAYCFAEVEGFSNFGSYVGTGTTSGAKVITGFEPAFVMIKGTSSGIPSSQAHWVMKDNKRDSTNPNSANLYANLSNQEDTISSVDVNFLENGFEIAGTYNGINQSGQSYIYMAFAADPTAVEPSLEDSFNTNTWNGGTPQSINAGFEPDLIWIKSRGVANNHILADTVRGIDGILYSNLTNAEASRLNSIETTSTGYNLLDTWAGRNSASYGGYVGWAWKGAEIPAINSNGSIPSVVSANPAAGFSIVSYNSNGTAGSTIGHGLGSSPDMIIIKNRDDVDKWAVYHSAIGGTKFLVLNETASAVSSIAYWNNTNPDSSTFTVGSTSPVNSPNNEDYIAYCFAEVAGFSKFGSYSGSSGDVYVNTGFEPAFVVVKSITGSYSWYMIDNKRGSTLPTSNSLFANLSNAEAGGYGIYFDSTGFTVSSGVGTGTNSSGNTYIYMAFANQF